MKNLFFILVLVFLSGCGKTLYYSNMDYDIEKKKHRLNACDRVTGVFYTWGRRSSPDKYELVTPAMVMSGASIAKK